MFAYTRLRTDSGRTVGVLTVIQLVWLTSLRVNKCNIHIDSI